MAAALALAGASSVTAQTVVSVGALGDGASANFPNGWTNTPFGNNNTTSGNFAFAQSGIQMTANSTQVTGVGIDNITTTFGNPVGLFTTASYSWSSLTANDQILFKMTLYGNSASSPGTPQFLGTLYYGQGSLGAGPFTDTVTNSTSLFYSSQPAAAGASVGTLQNLNDWVNGFNTSGLIVPNSATVVSIQLAAGSSGAHAPFIGSVSQLVLDGGTFGAANGGAAQTYTVNFVPEPGTIIGGLFAAGALVGVVGRRFRKRQTGVSA